MRFLHAADLHLDSPLRGLKRYEGMPHDEIRLATRRALDRLVETAIEEDVSFVILAGDLYDGTWKDASTGLYMAGALGRLTKHGIQVVTVSGNHDAESIITRRLPLPDGVYTFPTRHPATHRLEELRVALHGQSFANRHVPEDMTKNFPPPVPGWLNIGVLHTSLTGDSAHATYAPCTVEGLCALGYEYWALGHVHKRQIVHEDPWIVFPGVLQGRHARETGPCGGMIVEAEGDKILSVRPANFDTVRWEVVRLDLSALTEGTELARHARHALTQAMQEAEERLLVVRVLLQGATVLHGQLNAWQDDLRAIAAALGDRIALEKLCDETVPVPETRPASPLLEQMLSELLEDKSLPDTLENSLEDFLRLLPAGIERDTLVQDISRLMEQSAQALKTRLRGTTNAGEKA